MTCRKCPPTWSPRDSVRGNETNCLPFTHTLLIDATIVEDLSALLGGGGANGQQAGGLGALTGLLGGGAAGGQQQQGGGLGALGGLLGGNGAAGATNATGNNSPLGILGDLLGKRQGKRMSLRLYARAHDLC